MRVQRSIFKTGSILKRSNAFAQLNLYVVLDMQIFVVLGMHIFVVLDMHIFVVLDMILVVLGMHIFVFLDMHIFVVLDIHIFVVLTCTFLSISSLSLVFKQNSHRFLLICNFNFCALCPPDFEMWRVKKKYYLDTWSLFFIFYFTALTKLYRHNKKTKLYKITVRTLWPGWPSGISLHLDLKTYFSIVDFKPRCARSQSFKLKLERSALHWKKCLCLGYKKV